MYGKSPDHTQISLSGRRAKYAADLLEFPRKVIAPYGSKVSAYDHVTSAVSGSIFVSFAFVVVKASPDLIGLNCIARPFASVDLGAFGWQRLITLRLHVGHGGRSLCHDVVTLRIVTCIPGGFQEISAPTPANALDPVRNPV